MFQSLVRALIDYKNYKTATKAHAVDSMLQNIERDLHESILISEPLIRDNIVEFKASSSYLDFISRLTKTDFTSMQKIQTRLQPDQREIEKIEDPNSQNEIRDSLKANKHLQNQIQDLQNEKRDLQSEIRDLQKTIKHLQETNRQDLTSQSHIDELKKTIIKLQKQNEDQYGERDQNDKLERRIRKLNDDIKILEKDKMKYQNDYFDCQRDKMILQKNFELLEAQLRADKRHHEHEKETLQRTNKMELAKVEQSLENKMAIFELEANSKVFNAFNIKISRIYEQFLKMQEQIFKERLINITPPVKNIMGSMKHDMQNLFQEMQVTLRQESITSFERPIPGPEEENPSLPWAQRPALEGRMEWQAETLEKQTESDLNYQIEILLAESKNQKEKFEDQILNLKTEIKGFQNEIELFKKERDTLISEKQQSEERLESQIQDCKLQVEALKTQLDTTGQKYCDQIQTCKTKLAKANEENESLTERIRSMEIEHEDLLKENEAKYKSILASLKSENEQLKENDQNQALENKYYNLQIEQEAMIEYIEKIYKNISNMVSQETNSTNNAKQNLEQISTICTNLVTTYHKIFDTIERYLEEVKMPAIDQELLKKSEPALVMLEHFYKNCYEESKRKYDELLPKYQKRDKVFSEYKELTSKYDQLFLENNELKVKYDQLSTENNELKAKYGDLPTNYHELVDKHNKVSTELSNLDRKNRKIFNYLREIIKINDNTNVKTIYSKIKEIKNIIDQHKSQKSDEEAIDVDEMPVESYKLLQALNQSLIVKYFEQYFTYVLNKDKVDRVFVQDAYEKLSILNTYKEYEDFVTAHLAVMDSLLENKSFINLSLKFPEYNPAFNRFFDEVTSIIVNYIINYIQTMKIQI